MSESMEVQGVVFDSFMKYAQKNNLFLNVNYYFNANQRGYASFEIYNAPIIDKNNLVGKVIFENNSLTSIDGKEDFREHFCTTLQKGYESINSIKFLLEEHERRKQLGIFNL